MLRYKGLICQSAEVIEGEITRFSSSPLHDYRISLSHDEDPAMARRAFRALEYVLGARWNARFLRRAHRDAFQNHLIWSELMKGAGFEVHVTGLEQRAFPRGPVIVVSNHPTGMPDATFLGVTLERLGRSDITIFTIPALANVPFMRSQAIGFELPSAFGKRRGGGRRSLLESFAKLKQKLEEGRCVVAYPAGPGVERTPSGQYRDGPWHKTIFEFAMKNNVPVVPVYIDHQMTWLRKTLMDIHPLLYHAGFALEIRGMKGKSVTIEVGSPVLPDELRAEAKRRDVGAWMRERVYAMADRNSAEGIVDAGFSRAQSPRWKERPA